MNARVAVFLDRDGVLNNVVSIGGKTFPPANADALVIAAGAREAVEKLRAAEYLCICVTNQPDVARGTRTLDNVTAMNEKVSQALQLDDLFCCLHDNADNCSCRKPKPGMLLAAAKKWNIDLEKSWMIGDRPTDIMAGKGAGCETVLIAVESGEKFPSDFVCLNIEAAVDVILAHDGTSDKGLSE